MILYLIFVANVHLTSYSLHRILIPVLLLDHYRAARVSLPKLMILTFDPVRGKAASLPVPKYLTPLCQFRLNVFNMINLLKITSPRVSLKVSAKVLYLLLLKLNLTLS